MTKGALYRFAFRGIEWGNRVMMRRISLIITTLKPVLKPQHSVLLV